MRNDGAIPDVRCTARRLWSNNQLMNLSLYGTVDVTEPESNTDLVKLTVPLKASKYVPADTGKTL